MKSSTSVVELVMLLCSQVSCLSFIYLSNVVFQLHDTLSIVTGHGGLLKYLSE